MNEDKPALKPLKLSTLWTKERVLHFIAVCEANGHEKAAEMYRLYLERNFS